MPDLAAVDHSEECKKDILHLTDLIYESIQSGNYELTYQLLAERANSICGCMKSAADEGARQALYEFIQHIHQKDASACEAMKKECAEIQCTVLGIQNTKKYNP